MNAVSTARRAVSACAATLIVLVALTAAPATAAELPLAYRAWDLPASDPAAGARFGSSVAVWGDTAVVGAPYTSGERGAAYVFMRAGGAWTLRQKLIALDGAETDRFGWSVAIRGDTILIGAAGEDSYRGSAYVFTGSDGLWTQSAKLAASDGVIHDHFGCSVALDGSTAVIGATEDDDTRGAAYVFTEAGGVWAEQARLVADHRADMAYFGWSVAVEGDTVLVGAIEPNSPAGSAYVFTGSGDSWTQRAKLTASDGVTDDYFGCSVALSGGNALIGAHSDENLAIGAGSAYVFTGSGDTWTQRKKLTHAGEAALDHFGCAVGLSGGNAIVGAYADDTAAGSDAGSACAYVLSTELALGGVTRIAGDDRYLTAVAASERGFPVGAPAVVVATGANWPDALGGSALAGAAHGPLLLTRTDMLPAGVVDEIRRLGAVRAYVVGGTASISGAVEDTLVTLLGRTNVVRLGGSDRYATARLVADETIRLQGSTYGGRSFVATGLNYPDATAASPLAVWQGAPILLVDPRTGALYVPDDVTHACILGGESAVPPPVEAVLCDELGDDKVTRLPGANRYETAAMTAQLGVSGGMQWKGLGLATGENFPDALAAGPMLATNRSVLLLTRSDALSSEAAAMITGNAASIGSMFIFGGEAAVSPAVAAEAAAAAGTKTRL